MAKKSQSVIEWSPASGRPIREHVKQSYKDLWRVVQLKGRCDWMLSLEETASVTGPGGICCHGDLKAWLPWRCWWKTAVWWAAGAWPTAYSRAYPGDSGDHMQGHRDVACLYFVFECTCIVSLNIHAFITHSERVCLNAFAFNAAVQCISSGMAHQVIVKWAAA